jgi:hypothetical protein
MKARELWVRCQKARIISWLNSTKVGAVFPLGDGNAVILAIYDNGKYFEPPAASAPDDPSPLWGPDGPFTWNGLQEQEEQPGDSPEGTGEEEEPDGTE